MKFSSVLVSGLSLLPIATLAVDTCPTKTVTSRACATATRTVPVGILCPAISCGPVPDCIILSTATVGCVGRCCPTATPTVTVVDPCPTCQTGCAVSVTTTTAGCL